MFEAGAEAGSRAEEQGADGGVGFAEDGGDFGGGELVDGGEEEDVALGFREAVPLAEDGLETLGVLEGLVGGEGAGDETLGEEIVHLLGADAAAAIEGEVPGDADEPDAEVEDGIEGVAAFEDADEGVLDNVFGLGTAAEDGVGDAEEEGGVGLDEGSEVRFRPGGTREGKDQAAFLEGGHKCLDWLRTERVGEILPAMGTDGQRRGTLGRILFPKSGRVRRTWVAYGEAAGVCRSENGRTVAG